MNDHYICSSCDYRINEDEYVEELRKFLSVGNDIDINCNVIGVLSRVNYYFGTLIQNGRR